MQYRATVLAHKYRVALILLTITLLFAISINYLSAIHALVEPTFASRDKISDLRSLLQGIGAALIGATAIAFSLVMFAMQVNVERMPHGLFFKFSSDRLILFYFAGTFLLAIAVACSSLAIDHKDHAGLALLSAFWAILIIIVFIFSAFRRALFLINPIKQLENILRYAQNDLRVAGRRADIYRTLLESSQANELQQDAFISAEHDVPRIGYFHLNQYWTRGAIRSVDHCISFANRYAEQGDYEVSGEALRAIAEINASYVEAKGKTFFANVFDNRLTTDGFINHTLEHFRQTLRVALKRSDERQIEQALGALANLVLVYSNIDYGAPYARKTHAHLAAGYLSDAVQSTLSHDMPDVLMEGIRLMGQSALVFLVMGNPNEIVTLAEKIALVSCSGAANDKFRPVTLAGVEQLTRLTMRVLHVTKYDIRRAAKELQANISLIANIYLHVPDAPLSNIHQTYLAPYYSSTSQTCFVHWLTDLANRLIQAEADNESARAIVRNIETWADRLYDPQKKLLILSIERRSQFTFDMIHWIIHVTKLLFAISRAPACNTHLKDKIQKHALWLISTLTWIPDDKDTVAFAENFSMTETLFEVALDLHHRGYLEFSQKTTREILLSWAFKAGKYKTGTGILERALYGIATLVLMNEPHDEHVEFLKRKLTEYLAGPHAPEQEILDRTAREIRKRASTLYRDGHGMSRIEYAMSQMEGQKLRPLLEDIANMLSPRTA